MKALALALLVALPALAPAAQAAALPALLPEAMPRNCNDPVCWALSVVLPIIDTARRWASDPPLSPPEEPQLPHTGNGGHLA